ncbi:MAG: transcriptional regulator NrdR [Tepidisphaeraceae bacterium]
MRCPFCEADKEALKVIDSRTCDGGKSIRRRRECLKCGKRFTTYERIEDPVRLIVVKKDGRRVPWDREKIRIGLERSCFKRPVPEDEILRIVDEVEEEARKHHDREVPTDFIGKQVAERLRRLDQVAYVRFASVYRQFKTLEQLVEEAQNVLDAKRFEDPTQGTLFVEPAPPKPVPAETNGHASKRGRKKKADGPTADEGD